MLKRVAQRTSETASSPALPRTPITAVFDMPKTLITKDVLKEVGLGIHVLRMCARRQVDFNGDGSKDILTVRESRNSFTPRTTKRVT